MLNLEFDKDTFIELGGIRTGEEARAFLEGRLDWESVMKLRLVRNEMVLVKIANAISVADPKAVFINSGYKYELEWIKSRTAKADGDIMMIGFYSQGFVGNERSIPTLVVSYSASDLKSADEQFKNCIHNFDSEVERNGQFLMNVHTPVESHSANWENAPIAI